MEEPLPSTICTCLWIFLSRQARDTDRSLRPTQCFPRCIMEALHTNRILWASVVQLYLFRSVRSLWLL